MLETPNAPTSDWQRKERPPELFRRFEFENYGATRAFLDALAELSKQDGYYPNLSFGTTYANVTVQARDGTVLTQADLDFAAHIDEITGRTRAVEP